MSTSSDHAAPRQHDAAPTPRLDSSIRVRLERDHRLELERHAAEAGVPASTIVRNLIRNHLAKLREAERS